LERIQILLAGVVTCSFRFEFYVMIVDVTNEEVKADQTPQQDFQHHNHSGRILSTRNFGRSIWVKSKCEAIRDWSSLVFGFALVVAMVTTPQPSKQIQHHPKSQTENQPRVRQRQPRSLLPTPTIPAFKILAFTIFRLALQLQSYSLARTVCLPAYNWGKWWMNVHNWGIFSMALPDAASSISVTGMPLYSVNTSKS